MKNKLMHEIIVVDDGSNDNILSRYAHYTLVVGSRFADYLLQEAQEKTKS